MRSERRLRPVPRVQPSFSLSNVTEKMFGLKALLVLALLVSAATAKNYTVGDLGLL